MEEPIRETQPEGALVPPPRIPPGAIATATPEPPRKPRHASVRRSRVEMLIGGLMDKLDSVADRVAQAMGLR